MRVAITYRALSAWPNDVPATSFQNRQRSPFRSPWSATLDDLDRELYQIGARHIVIEIDAPPTEIRRDGIPRADARTRSPGVIVTFEKRRRGAGDTWERFRYPCDTYHDWQDNVRAIAKTLEALRACDRYGVTTNGQQYAGFKALPEKTGTTLSVQQAAELLRRHSGINLLMHDPDFESTRRAFRAARARTHPDANPSNGDSSAWHEVQAAAERLGDHFGVSL